MTRFMLSLSFLFFLTATLSSDEGVFVKAKKMGALVEVATKVKEGDIIGYSGKTGMARGPHLHFIVYKAVDGKSRESFPVKFMSEAGIISDPIKGNWYRAK